MARTEYVAAGILLACRTALVNSPTASRVVLAKHRTSVEPTLAKNLGIVGGFKDEIITQVRTGVLFFIL